VRERERRRREEREKRGERGKRERGEGREVREREREGGESRWERERERASSGLSELFFLSVPSLFLMNLPSSVSGVYLSLLLLILYFII